MAEDASHQVARQVVARLCQPLGWQGMQNGACDVLADLLRRYILSLGKTTAAYVANANRTDPSPEDVACAFKDMEISLPDLLTYARLVDSTPLSPLPPYPLPSRSAHIYSRPSTPVMKPRPSLSEDDEEDEEEGIIPSYFPPLPSKADEDKDETESGVHDGGDRDEPLDIADPLSSLADPNRGLPQMYRSRSRLSSEFSEEGGEGGSRRGSISDRGASNTEVAATSVTGDTGPQNRPITPLSDDITQKPPAPQHPLHNVNTTGGVALITTTDSVSQQTTTLSHSSDLEPSTQPLAQSTSSATNEGGLPSAPLTPSTRPPPLRLMSTVDPTLSPILTSPVGGVRPSLPLLSPLNTTPSPYSTHTTKPQVLPTTSPSRVVAMTNTPQLTPTTTKPPLGTLNSAHQQSLGATTPVNTQSSSTHANPQHLIPDLDSDPTESDSKQSTNERESLHHIQKSTLQSSPDVAVASEPSISSPGEAKPPSSEVEQLAREETPFTTEEVEHATERQPSLSPQYPHLPAVHPSTVPLEGDGDQGEEGEGDDDSVVSSLSSKPVSPEVPPVREDGQEQERTSNFEKDQRNDGSDGLRLLDAACDFDVEVGGEGGVASILHGEDEMELPDIEKQLEMSESEDSSSGSSDSEDHSQPTGLNVKSQGEIVDVRKELLVPKMASVRSSSHSLASTPSDSPCPSPIPHSTPLPSQYPVPIPTSDPKPYLTQLQPALLSHEQPKTKPIFSITPPDSTHPPGSLVVSFRRHLIPSYGKAKKVGARRKRGTQSQPAAPRVPKEVSKLKRTCTTSAVEASETAASPLVVSILRSNLFTEPFGLTASVQPTGVQYSDDDDMIVTHSSAEQVKVNAPRVKIDSERVKSSQGLSTERVTQQRFSRHAPSSPSAERGVAGGVAMGVWKRELDISEMGLLPPAPVRTVEEQQVKIIPQSSSSSSSSEDSDTGSGSSSHSSPSPLPTPVPLPPSRSPTPSLWQQPMRSEDEESTSSSATGGGGGLKLKLKISKALLQNVTCTSAPSFPKAEKKGRKRGSTLAVPMATTTSQFRGGRVGDVPKRGRPKGSSKASKKSTSNIPLMKIPKIELPGLPDKLSRQQTTPHTEGGGILPVAVSTSGEVWFCPQCGKPDDGSPMIGCDGPCEGWYHWYCVGVVTAPPENEKWFCPSCAPRGKKGRKRKNY